MMKTQIVEDMILGMAKVVEDKRSLAKENAELKKLLARYQMAETKEDCDEESDSGESGCFMISTPEDARMAAEMIGTLLFGGKLPRG